MALNIDEMTETDKYIYKKALEDKERMLIEDLERIRNKKRGLGDFTNKEVEKKFTDYFKD